MAHLGAQDLAMAEKFQEATRNADSSDDKLRSQGFKDLDEIRKQNSWAVLVQILEAGADKTLCFRAVNALHLKLSYDLSAQPPPFTLEDLRDRLLWQLGRASQKDFGVVRRYLCVCLAVVAIYLKGWNDVISYIDKFFETHFKDSPNRESIMLTFLRVLPEEVTEGRKISLSEEDLEERTQILLGNNANVVVQILVGYSQSAQSQRPDGSKLRELLMCIVSWLREIPVAVIANSSLLGLIFRALTIDDCSQEASECMCSMLRDTSDVDENQELIEFLFSKLRELRPHIEKAVHEEDVTTFKALTQVFATAAESWVVAIARQPIQFRPVVEAVLECAARDVDRDVMEYTFNFWYELKQYLTLERYIEARLQFVEVYSQLMDILLKHLEYPVPESGDESDLFDGNRLLEDNFREFRHQMGDTLKDACEVIGVTDCLGKVQRAIQQWVQKYWAQLPNPSVLGAPVPHWQELEAPLFSMRALGRMVDKDENIVLPQIMPELVKVPNHEKLRFATVMVLGRYTEWTAAHPEYLEDQFKYIIASLEWDSKEIIRAAALSMKFFCVDCKNHLSGQVLEMQNFYDQTLDKLPDISKEEMTEGVANVVAVQPPSEIYGLLKAYCDPLVQRLMAKANDARTAEEAAVAAEGAASNESEKKQASELRARCDTAKYAVADHLQLLTIFAQNVLPGVNPGEENPAVKYWQEVFPVLSAVLQNFLSFTAICENICRCWRSMVISYRTAISPLLAEMANQLASAFTTSRNGCFLWVTSAIMREFSEDREHVDQATTDNIYGFFEAQATAFLQALSEFQPKQLPDVVDDFFRLLIDALLYYPQRFIPSALTVPIFEAATYALTLEQQHPLSSTLHFLRDLISYGGNNPASSDGIPPVVAADLRTLVRSLLASHGGNLVKQVMTGMMITFPRDCFADGSGVLLALFELLPGETTQWVAATIQLLPAGTVSPADAERLMVKISEKLQSGDAGAMRHVRALLQDFTTSYRRRNVAPTNGLGALEAEKFRLRA